MLQSLLPLRFPHFIRKLKSARTKGDYVALFCLNFYYWYKILVAMAVYALVSIIISVLSYKSLKVRRIVSGNSLILLDNGELYQDNLKKAKLDLNEFLMQCRTSRIF